MQVTRNRVSVEASNLIKPPTRDWGYSIYLIYPEKSIRLSSNIYDLWFPLDSESEILLFLGDD